MAEVTFTTGNNVPVTLQDDTDLGVNPPLRLFDVINHRQQTILYVQLPALCPGTGGQFEATSALQDVSHAISKMRFAVVEDKNHLCIDAEDQRRPKTITERYPSQHDCILKLNHVDDEKDLPPIWHQMANWKKDGESLLMSLQNQVMLTANHYDKKAFRLKVYHKSALENFEFAGDKINIYQHQLWLVAFHYHS